jgi:sigma-B regulation protein RsbU (phosphoserine phosphatase)
MARIRTFKSKILLLVLFVLLTAAISLVVLSRREIESGLDRVEQQAARDVLYLVLQTIENQYQDMMDHNRKVLDMRKEAMRNLSALVVSTIDRFYDLYRKGLLSEDEAKRQALEQVKSIRYGHDDYFFVYDANYTAISHPDPLFMGKNLKNYRDAKGVLVVQELMKASREQGGGFVPYWWKRLNEKNPVRKMGYAIFYPKWQWMIGTGLYIDDLDDEFRRKLDAIVVQLKATFSKIRAKKGASLFLFDGKGKLVISPSGWGDERPRFQELMSAAETPDRPLRYLVQTAPTSAKKTWREAYVVHFQPLDWYIVGTFDEAELEKPGKILMQKAVVFMLVATLVSLALAYIIAAKVTRPLSQLAGYAKSLPSRDFRPEPDSAVQALSNRGDEVGRLAEAFLFMQKMLQSYLGHLKETTAAKERIESELKIAHDIQMSMVPKTFPPFPHRKEFDIYATLVPAREVGGDFYDFFFIDDRRLCFAVGDVSGKGVPASLFMALTKTMFRATGGRQNATAELILSRLNGEICRDNDSCMFVTVFCAVLDVRTGQLEYSNAGHNLPYLLSDGVVTALSNPGGMALGVTDSTKFYAGHIMLKPGDRLVLYTDGVTEAMDKHDELFSEGRLETTLHGVNGLSSKEVIERVVEEVQRFSTGAPQSDDITLLVLSYLGPKEGDPHILSVQLRNDLSELERLNRAVAEFAEQHGLASELVYRVNLVLEEIITNVISYGYEDSSEHEIFVRLSWKDPRIEIEIKDDGRPFNPLEAPQPDIGKPLVERQIGGLGIHLVRKMMDDLEYRRESDKNFLVLKTKVRET